MGTGEIDACPAGACRPRPPAGAVPEVDPSAWRVRRRRALRRASGGRSADPSAPGAIGALILDVGGVVIPSLFESVAIPGFPAGPLADEPGWRRVQRGEVRERDYWSAVARERPDLDIGALWTRCSEVREELRSVLDSIAGRVRLVAFTNDMTHFFGEDWPRRFPEFALFDELIEARQLGVDKPEPGAFRAAAHVLGEALERCLFVDDLAVNVAGAGRAGMRTRLFDVNDPASSIAAVLADLALKGDESSAPPRVFRRPRPEPVAPAR